MYSQYGWFSPTGVAVSSSAGPGAAPDGPRRPDGAAHGPSWPGLQASALQGRDVVILSLASAGPTQSIAVTLAALLAAVGYASFLPLLICFIPMLGIAVGYQRLNAWQPSAGATYSWVGRALGIKLSAGFQWGWAIFEYGLLVGFAIAAIAGIAHPEAVGFFIAASTFGLLCETWRASRSGRRRLGYPLTSDQRVRLALWYTLVTGALAALTAVTLFRIGCAAG